MRSERGMPGTDGQGRFLATLRNVTENKTSQFKNPPSLQRKGARGMPVGAFRETPPPTAITDQNPLRTALAQLNVNIHTRAKFTSLNNVYII